MMCKRLLCLACCIFVLGMATAASAQLLVHYKLDETSGTVAADASGNGFDGTIEGTPGFVEGKFDGAMEFWGSENVTFPAEAMGMTSFIGSVAFWMKADVPTGIYTMFWAGDNITGGGFGPENEMHIHLESAVSNVWIGGELSFYLRADPNPNVHLHSDPDKSGADDPGAVPVNPTLMGDGLWHHIAGVWDGGAGAAKLYIDGILIMEWPYVSSMYELSNIFLGKMAGGGRTYMGVLDDFRIYSQALTDVDVYYLSQGMEVHVNDNPAALPQEFVLNQNYPNPFNPATTISYRLAKSSDVVLDVYTQNGQKVRTLVKERLGSGFQSVNWDGRDDAGKQLSSGIYLYRLQVGNQVQTRKLMLMK
ncbi:T9SS type A sorting domain-containing protein [bacterium]|nr:T9SS type A sorting domain-containing protein [bacterium]